MTATSLLSAVWRLPRSVLVALLELYQATLSPDHGPLKHLYPYGVCRHEPTCSEYGKIVLTDRGVIIGMILLLKRVLSCHPWKGISEEKVRKMLNT